MVSWCRTLDVPTSPWFHDVILSATHNRPISWLKFKSYFRKWKSIGESSPFFCWWWRFWPEDSTDELYELVTTYQLWSTHNMLFCNSYVQENKSQLGRDIHCENEIKPTKPPISTWFSYQKSRYRIDPWFSQNVIDLLGRWWTYDWYDWTEVCVYINGKNGTRPLLGRGDILWYLWWYKPPSIHLLDSEVIQVSSRGDCKSWRNLTFLQCPIFESQLPTWIPIDG